MLDPAEIRTVSDQPQRLGMVLEELDFEICITGVVDDVKVFEGFAFPELKHKMTVKVQVNRDIMTHTRSIHPRSSASSS